MNIFEVQGNWNIAKGKLKQKFAQVTDDAWQFREGKEDELTGRIQKRTGHLGPRPACQYPSVGERDGAVVKRDQRPLAHKRVTGRVRYLSPDDVNHV